MPDSHFDVSAVTPSTDDWKWAGYTCRRCGQWIAKGHFHICPKLFATDRFSGEVALERVAAAAKGLMGE